LLRFRSSISIYVKVHSRGGENKNFSFSRQRFQELATEAVEVKVDSIRETFTALKLESMGVFTKSWRDPLVTNPDKKGCDFLIENGPDGLTHLEIKGPVDPLIRFNQGMSGSVARQSKEIERKSQKQPQHWVSEEWRVEKKIMMTPPYSPNKVLLVFDLLDVSFDEQGHLQEGIEESIKREAKNKSQNPHKHLMFFNKKDPI